MKVSNRKFKKMLAVAGLSSTMILTACVADDDDDLIDIDGKTYKKGKKNGEEGYYTSSGAFVPFRTLPPTTEIKPVKKGNSGLGSSVKSSGRGATS